MNLLGYILNLGTVVPPPPVYGLSIAPGRIKPSATTTVTYYGTGTTWSTTAPTISASGAPAGDGSWSIGALTVDSDTQAHRSVTTGATRGTVTWTDSTTSQTATQTVATRKPMLVLPRRYRT